MSSKRRTSKPLMEKRRRDRINQSLAELKELIATSAHHECNYRRNRLEKADILEMTVQYVHQLHNKRNESIKSAKNDDISVDSNDRLFVNGFLECVKEIKNYCNQRDDIDWKEDNLLRHLENCVRQLTENDKQPNKAQQPLGLAFVWRPW
ncbi:hypothetical protein CHUAL_012442 [Chamberlinius hualienensis]